MRYFKSAETLEELRKQYKELLKKYHPDNKNGSEDATKAINAEYEQLFKTLKNQHDTKHTDNANGAESSYNSNMYDWENDKALREALQKIINFEGIEILICGQWIWVDGNTYKYKKELKEIGFKWASQKKKWFFHAEKFRKLSRRNLSMNEIMNYYGSTKVYPERERRLLEA